MCSATSNIPPSAGPPAGLQGLLATPKNTTLRTTRRSPAPSPSRGWRISSRSLSSLYALGALAALVALLTLHPASMPTVHSSLERLPHGVRRDSSQPGQLASGVAAAGEAAQAAAGGVAADRHLSEAEPGSTARGFATQADGDNLQAAARAAEAVTWEGEALAGGGGSEAAAGAAGSASSSSSSSSSGGRELPPKVALMFLTRGAMPLERMWREFFVTAGQIEPVTWPSRREAKQQDSGVAGGSGSSSGAEPAATDSTPGEQAQPGAAGRQAGAAGSLRGGSQQLQQQQQQQQRGQDAAAIVLGMGSLPRPEAGAAAGAVPGDEAQQAGGAGAAAERPLQLQQGAAEAGSLGSGISGAGAAGRQLLGVGAELLRALGALQLAEQLQQQPARQWRRRLAAEDAGAQPALLAAEQLQRGEQEQQPAQSAVTAAAAAGADTEPPPAGTGGAGGGGSKGAGGPARPTVLARLNTQAVVRVRSAIVSRGGAGALGIAEAAAGAGGDTVMTAAAEQQRGAGAAVGGAFPQPEQQAQQAQQPVFVGTRALPDLSELLGPGFVRSEEDSAPSKTAARDPKGVIAQQDLFSVYVHTAPDFLFQRSSIFSGYEIADRVQVTWGQFTVAEAERRLVMAALADPRNTRLLLLSESCAPLYPPQVVYMQMLSDQQSRLNACSKAGRISARWFRAMYRPGLLSPFRWRKSSQWKSLLREHGEIVAGDNRLWMVFRQDCYAYLADGRVPMPPHFRHRNASEVADRNCVSDEHYVPTLLAMHHRDSETTCQVGGLTHTEWPDGGWSPHVHNSREVSRPLLARLRQLPWATVQCDGEGAIASANTMFRRRQGQRAGRALGGGAGAKLHALTGQPPHFDPLPMDCFLFARKFSPDAAPWLVVLARDCARGTGIAASCLPK